MPYVVNGYGKNSNKKKTKHRTSNAYPYVSLRDTYHDYRVDARKSPFAYHPAPEPDLFDCCVHDDNCDLFGPRGNKTENYSRVQKKNFPKNKKKPVEKKIDFSEILADAVIYNKIKLSLLHLENHLIDIVDYRLDGPMHFAKYQKNTPEENIKSVVERRNFVRSQMRIQLSEYLVKRSVKYNTCRHNIHYAFYASSIKILDRIIEESPDLI
jgi:hypothetical protein